MTGRVLSFPRRPMSGEEGIAAAKAILEMPLADPSIRASLKPAEDPETLLSICRLLRDQLEGSPRTVYEKAGSLFRFLAEPKRPIGIFDERDYFLGELALLTGTAARILARGDEAARWFDRSEGAFRLTVNAVADWSRVSYQRLALLLEKRKYDELLELLPALADSFRKLDMIEEALKCRFLESGALMETGRLEEAAGTFREILEESRQVRNEKMVSSALVNLVHAHGMLGDIEEATRYSGEAVPLLRRLNNRVDLAKVQWGIGSLLRARGQVAAAVDAFRSAEVEFSALGMKADVAATQLMIADLLLESSHEDLALREILSALPVIEEFRMVPEGMAALALLRESVRHQKVNHQALRDLHGFFEDSAS